jgi:hypothetical protein
MTAVHLCSASYLVFFQVAFPFFHPPSTDMAIDTFYHDNQRAIFSETSRLRLMTLLSLYDMLPHSISHPPNGREPLDLEDAIDPETVKCVLELVQAKGATASSLSNSHQNSVQVGNPLHIYVFFLSHGQACTTDTEPPSRSVVGKLQRAWARSRLRKEIRRCLSNLP